MPALLSIAGVSKSLWRGATELVLLEDISLDVNPGELVAVWGQRGSGKTTMAMVAAGLESPDKGSVSFAGHDLALGSRGRKGSVHPEIGWVQRMGPRSGDLRTVADYLTIPLLGDHSARKARRLASAMLARLGVADCVGKRWENLTDGERTLVAIAHALVREPRLLIADDPTSNLNVLQREEVTGLLRRAADEEGLAILMMVPDMPTMAYADRVGSLSDGRLAMAREPAPTRNVIDFPGTQRSA